MMKLPETAFVKLFRVLIFAVCGALSATGSFAVDHPQPQSGPFATVLTDAAIDDAVSAEWFDGAEHLLANPKSLRQVLWTQATAPAGNFLYYGASPQPGIRHLRLGLKTPLQVGSVLVRGGDSLSVLRPQAAYPGDLADDSQWMPAERVVNRQSSTAPVDHNSYALWTFPPGTTTRALRFTHDAPVTDSTYAGVLGGAYLLSARFINLAPQAIVDTSANAPSAPLLTNEKDDGWLAWDNGPTFPHPVSATTPEWITLSWPRPVSLNGLATLWAGFNQADAQIFTGPDSESPQDAPDSAWQNIGTPLATHSQYPRPLGVDWVDFGKTVTTRAVRLRITGITDEARSSHLAGKTRNGNRVWLGELMALSPLAASPLQTAVLPAVVDNGPKPPIAIHFNLQSAGFVSLVIDDAQGNRVRNLVSDTWFGAGLNTVWWDGTDDLGRNPDAAQHGVYLIPTHFVAPGQYQVRGITHKPIDLHYEFTVYEPGNPPWETVDTKGGWLTNHTPPSSALFLPADKAPGGKPLVYLGSFVSEGGAGLAWVDLDGNKQGGRGWIGGSWTAAPYLARDTGSRADPDAYAYVGAAWRDDTAKDSKQLTGIIRLTALTQHGDKSLLNFRFFPGDRINFDDGARPIWNDQIGGLAVRDGLVVISLTRQEQLLFADARSGKVLGQIPLPSPRGLAFDAQGRLLVLSASQLLRYTLASGASQFNPQQLPTPEPLIATGLEDPAGIIIDANGALYISDRGNSNQVKVFSGSGKLLHTIGHAGPSQPGPYDPLHMNQPRGMAIDSNNHLWVAEEDYQPKRVGLWTLDGKLLKALYGPAEYGGGGSLDPRDKTKFYYHGMELKLDWQAGKDSIASVLYRPRKDEIVFPPYSGPESVLYSNGHRYFTNTFLAYGSNGVSVAFLYLDTAGILRPVAALGKANYWNLLKTDAFKSRLPPGANLSSNAPNDSVLFTWSDLNGNGRVDPEEVTFRRAYTGSITLQSDPVPPSSDMPALAMYDSVVDGKATRFIPVRITPEGVPVYDINHGETLVDGAQPPRSDGGGQILYSPQNIVLTTAPAPFAQESLGGVDSHGHRWSYPDLWPGLHPSHSAPVPDRPGEVIGATRLLGEFINPTGSDAGPLWGINGNFGDMYLFTADGLYVTQLFQDVRTGKPWNMPEARRNMPLNDISMHDENFFPSLTQTNDGNVYVADGGHTSIVRVDGLGSVQRIPASPLDVTKTQLDQAQHYMQQKEAERQAQIGKKTLDVTVQSGPAPALGSLVASLASASWATVDRRITQVGWAGQPDLVEAAITIAGGRLFAAYRSSNPNLLVNSGAIANAPFKSGGALDLMIGTDPHADPKREAPVAGDIRLLVYLVQGKLRATLYRAVVPGTANPVPFTSPSRTITLDKVEDVSDELQFNAAKGEYTFSIPLKTLGLAPSPGDKIKADIGILRGSPVQTLQRVYWSNKTTGITSDVPTEAELTPNLWGDWIFKAAH